MHSVFAECLNLSRGKDLGNQIHTIPYYIAKRYPAVDPIFLPYCVIPNFIPFMSYTEY